MKDAASEADTMMVNEVQVNLAPFTQLTALDKGKGRIINKEPAATTLSPLSTAPTPWFDSLSPTCMTVENSVAPSTVHSLWPVSRVSSEEEVRLHNSSDEEGRQATMLIDYILNPPPVREHTPPAAMVPLLSQLAMNDESTGPPPFIGLSP
jgi:hypothetical protein